MYNKSSSLDRVSSNSGQEFGSKVDAAFAEIKNELKLFQTKFILSFIGIVALSLTLFFLAYPLLVM